MDATTLLLGAGQVLLAIAIGYIAWTVRRESKRSALLYAFLNTTMRFVLVPLAMLSTPQQLAVFVNF